MSDRAPIPPEAFAAAVERLDRDALAEFVGRLYAAADTADVAVEPPAVTVDDGDARRRLVVVAGGSDADADADPDLADADTPDTDAVVVGGAFDADPGIPVRTATDLRHRLLYAVPPAAAESIAEAHLGVPARASSYVRAPESTPADPTDRGDGDGGGGGDEDEPRGTGPTDAGAVRGSGAAGGTAAPPSGHAGPAAHHDGTPQGTATADADGSARADSPRGRAADDRRDPSGADGDPSGPSGAAARGGAGLVVAGVLAVVILAVTGGVVYAAEVSPGGDAGAFAAPAAIDAEGLSKGEIRRRSRGAIDGSSVVTTTATPDGEATFGPLGGANDTEAARNVRPVPTCERSFLNVVQIQVNALKYNDNATDDGIRTVRRFASPRNRQTIQTFDEFATVIRSPTYSPLLSHNSAQYTPIQSSDDYAQVEVITREDGNTTGQYYFRLRKVDGGEYDGCWMTDAVVSVPETTNFSGEVAGRTTGSTNATA